MSSGGTAGTTALPAQLRRIRIAAVVLVLSAALVICHGLPWLHYSAGIREGSGRSVSGWRTGVATDGVPVEGVLAWTTAVVLLAVVVAVAAAFLDAVGFALVGCATAVLATVVVVAVLRRVNSSDTLTTVGTGLGTTVGLLPLLVASCAWLAAASRH